jgi:hypothetical protein
MAGRIEPIAKPAYFVTPAKAKLDELVKSTFSPPLAGGD